MVEAKMLSSMILYGPPGTEKPLPAQSLVQQIMPSHVERGHRHKKDLQIVAEEAKMSGTVILLLDEIHRLDKTKQDFCSLI